MKTRLNLPLVLRGFTLAFLLLPPMVASAAEGAGWYWNVDAGVALVSDMGVEKTQPRPQALHSTTTFLPGPRLSLGGGYKFSDWFSAGADFGAMINEADNDQLTSYYLIQAPLLANLEFRWPNRSGFVPMIGGGPGGAFRIFTPADSGNLGNAEDFTFAWQLYGGVRYTISDKCSIGLAYKYLDMPSTLSGRFDVGGDLGYGVRFEGTHTHTLSLRFQMDF